MGKKYGMVEFKDVYEIDMSTGNPLLISGDSGSSVWNTDNELIGIGFAAGSRYSYVLPIGRILDEFNITV
jgi:S1-C subfamily serine protease